MDSEERDLQEILKMPTNGKAWIGAGRAQSLHVKGVHSLIGTEVHDNESEGLGAIADIMLDMHTGRVSFAVLAVGGLFGIGTKFYAVPWDTLTLDTANRRFVLDIDKQQLDSAPTFDRKKWAPMADPLWARSLRRL